MRPLHEPHPATHEAPPSGDASELFTLVVVVAWTVAVGWLIGMAMEISTL